MVSAYLEIAELQALNKKPMYMKDWIEKVSEETLPYINNFLNCQ